MAGETTDRDLVVGLLLATRDDFKFQVFNIYPKLLKREDFFLAGMDLMWLSVYPHFEKATYEAGHIEARDLASAGLAGNELQVKANWIRVLSQKLHEAWNSISKTGQELVVRILKAFNIALNSFLGSLATLIPGVEPIKEFKEYLESGLEVI